MTRQLMASEDIERYLSGVLEFELNLYIQQKTLDEMERRYNSLAKPKKIYKPEEISSNIADDIVSGMMSAAPICAIIAALIGGILEYISSRGGFWGIFAGIFMAFVYGIIGFIAGGLIIGAIVGICINVSKNKQLHLQHQNAMVNYAISLDVDAERVKKEQKSKNALLKEINTMRSCQSKTAQCLKQIYGCNILAYDYRNIYAVSSIYGYFSKGRTKSLGFNEVTGDQGAYNIYENERRLDRIITNTEEILKRLDDAVMYQHELVKGLKRANARIESLCGSISSHINRISGSLDSIERCQSIVAYNSERAANELEFMNWMHCFGY